MNQSEENPDLDVVRIEDTFSSLLTKVGDLVNSSMVLVSHFKRKLDQTLHKAFTPELQEDIDAHFPLASEEQDMAYMRGVRLDEVLESFFDFGRSLAEDFRAVVTQVFDELHSTVEEAEKEGGTLMFKSSTL